jgi:ankyrin repeat protein
MCTLLVEAGADVSKADENLDTALHRASQTGAVPIVELLLRNGAEAKAKNTLGEVPADVALPRKRALVLDALTRSAAS